MIAGRSLNLDFASSTTQQLFLEMILSMTYFNGK
jgi:hypothetical protein